MWIKPRYLLTLTLLLLSYNGQSLFGQEFKIEKEERVGLTEVPTQSVEWLNAVFPNNAKVKWYRETTSGKTSYEAKFKYFNKNYSVEFSESGDFEDIEFLVNWKALNSNVKGQLLTLLSDFDKIKIKKVQKQWTSPAQELLTEAIQKADAGKITERFELVFQAKKDNKYHIWEALLSLEKLISIREVKLLSTANLDF